MKSNRIFWNKKKIDESLLTLEQHIQQDHPVYIKRKHRGLTNFPLCNWPSYPSPLSEPRDKRTETVPSSHPCPNHCAARLRLEHGVTPWARNISIILLARPQREMRNFRALSLARASRFSRRKPVLYICGYFRVHALLGILSFAHIRSRGIIYNTILFPRPVCVFVLAALADYLARCAGCAYENSERRAWKNVHRGVISTRQLNRPSKLPNLLIHLAILLNL